MLFMKRLIMGGLFFILIGCGVQDEETQNRHAKIVPWNVSINENGTTNVIGVDIGNATFKDIMFKLKLLAEPAVFEAPDGTLTLEAYFGKKKFGVLTARLIVEMDADQALLKTMKQEQADKDSTPSNHWKYALNVKNTKRANDLRVWKLIYLPITDYEPKQMNFFGEPAEKLTINETAQYWLYPEKGMVLLYDTAGKEIFYYVAPKDFARLKAGLPKETVMIIR